MGKGKHRPPNRGQTYAQRLTQRREARDHIIQMWTAQLVLDVIAGVLNDPAVMGRSAMGAKRLTRVSEAFNERFPEYLQAITRNPESDYIRAKIDQQQARIFGPDYLRWPERYEYWEEE